MAGPDRNRVADYMATQRSPFDLDEFALGIRDAAGADDDDETVRQGVAQLRSSGKGEADVVNELGGLAKREATKRYAEQRAKAQKIADQAEREAAAAEAETGVQTTFRLIGDMLGAYAGGDLNRVSDTVRKVRQQKRARADQLAGQASELEIRGLDAEREDAQAQAKLGADAERERRQASRRTVERSEDRNVQYGRDERADERARLDRESRERAASARPRGRTPEEIEAARVRGVSDQRETNEINRNATDEKTRKAAVDKVEYFVREAENNLIALDKLIETYGTYEATGTHKADFERRVNNIAVALAKLGDADSAAREAEVKLAREGLVERDAFQSDATARQVLQNVLAELEQKRADAYSVRGIEAPAPRSKGGGVGGAAGGGSVDPAEVKRRFKAGKITREEARRLLGGQ